MLTRNELFLLDALVVLWNFSTDSLTNFVFKDRYNSIMNRASDLIFWLLDVTLTCVAPFGKPRYVQYLLIMDSRTFFISFYFFLLTVKGVH